MYSDSKFLRSLGGLFLYSVMSTAQAGAILQVTSIDSSQPLLKDHPLESGINQSGLSSNYISGETDFDTFISSRVTHDNLNDTTFATDIGVSSVSLLLDLGELESIESFALWNRANPVQGIKDFNLIASTDALFSDAILLGSFTAQTGLTDNGESTLAEIFSFAPTSAAYVQMEVTSIYGSCCVSFGELAFELSPKKETAVSTTEVPEPPVYALLMCAFMFAFRRRQQAHEYCG